MSGVIISNRFDTEAYPLRKVISIAKDGLVIAHVNASDSVPEAEETAKILAAAFEMAEALRDVVRWLDNTGAIHATDKLVLHLRAALAKAGL
jgi:hypothetical protein